MADLLLHSLAEFDELIFEVFDRFAPTSVLEIGSETGRFSKQLMERCFALGGELVTVEPAPTSEIVALAAASERFHLYAARSVDYLASEGCRSTFVLVDGDHNYYTVHTELSLIAESWRASGTSGIVLLHDVGFPCARRDFYYDPSSIPPEARHPYSFHHGVTLDSPSLVSGGFRGAGHFAWALREGGPRNGVLTAIEDFVRARPEYAYRSVDAIFGLGALTLEGSRADEIVSTAFAKYDHALLRRMERNRLALYLRVLELQDELAALQARAATIDHAAEPCTPSR